MADVDRRSLLAGGVMIGVVGVTGASASTAEAPLLPGLRVLQVEAGGVSFAGAIGGSGPPLLLIHGWPETHIAWRKVAGALARRFTLVIPDLPSYGASVAHSMTPRWTKRRVGAALVELMRTLGFERFAIAGHDRGARAAYRLVLDHPGIVTRFASLAVVPTLDAMAAVDYRYATRSFHWFLMAQEADLPERMLSASPDAFLDHALDTMGAGDGVIEPAVRSAYREAFRRASVRHAMCEDYRAGIGEDLELDAADRKAGRRLDCPVLMVAAGGERRADSPSEVDIWHRWADDVVGAATTGGHLQMEDRSDEVVRALLEFLA